MPGLYDFIDAFAALRTEIAATGKAMSSAAGDGERANRNRKDSTTSSMGTSGSGAVGTGMGAAATNSPVTTVGLKNAILVARRSL